MAIIGVKGLNSWFPDFRAISLPCWKIVVFSIWSIQQNIYTYWTVIYRRSYCLEISQFIHFHKITLSFYTWRRWLECYLWCSLSGRWLTGRSRNQSSLRVTTLAIRRLLMARLCTHFAFDLAFELALESKSIFSFTSNFLSLPFL